MAKRSIKRPPQLEKNNAGCLWPLISLFDFHKSPPTPRLTSDVLPASSRQGGKGDSKIKLDKPSSNRGKYEDAKNVTGIKAKGDDASFASVKTLMKEEMVRERSNKYKLTSDSDVNNQTELLNLVGQGSDKIKLTNGSSLDSDLIAFLVEFYTNKKSHKDINVYGNDKIDLIAMVQKLNDHPSEFDSQLNRKDYSLFQALADVFEAIANQKYVDMRHLLDNVSQSKELMEALEIINSNKDAVLKLLKDPDWYIYKCQEGEAGKFDSFGFENYSENVRMFQEDSMRSKKCNQLENEDMGHDQSRPRFFWRKDRSKEKESEKKSEDSENQTRMLVEKPTKATKKGQEIKSVRNLSHASQSKTGGREAGDRVLSNFSLREIKRKIKDIIGGNKKERRAISMDGILHKIPIGHKVPGDKEKLLYNDIVVASSKSKYDKEKPPIAKENDSKVNPEDCKPRIGNDISAIKSTPPIYAEAKKHLADILDTEGQTASYKTARASKSLGKLFSMQEDDALCMKMSRRDEKEVVLPSEEAGPIPLQKLKEEDANNSSSPSKQNMEFSSCLGDYRIDEGILGLKTEFVDKCVISDPDHDESVQNGEKSDAISNLLTDQSDNEAGVARATSNVDLAHSMIQSTPTSFCKENSEAPEKTTMRPGRPIPVSILEKFIPEDFTIPKLRAAHPIFPTKEERTTSSPRTYFANRRARVEYIETILEASGLKTIDFSRWHLADNLLEPSIFYEVESSCYPQIEDPKLLFDCINEAIQEIQENFFKCTPWVSLLSSNVPITARRWNLSKEVNRIIERHMPLDFSDSIDPLVTRDMEVGSWMGLQFETEEAALEIWDTALDDLVEEAIFDLWLDLSADW